MMINRINKRGLRVLIMFIVCVSTFVVGTIVSNASAYPGVEYRACTENTGWLKWVRNKETAGDVTKSEKIQVVKIILTDTNAGGIKYKTFNMGEGWSKEATNGDAIGSTSGIQAIKIELFGDIKTTYSVKYRVHILGKDWTEWLIDGKEAGVTTGNDVIDGIEMVLSDKQGQDIISDAVDYSKDLPVTENIQPSESKSTEIVENSTPVSSETTQGQQTTEVQNTRDGGQTVDTQNTTDGGQTVDSQNTSDNNQQQTQDVQQSNSSKAEELAKKLVDKAQSEVTYKAEADGTTKYGQWWANKVGDNAFAKAKWSSMFLAWCGDQVGLADEQYGYYACSDYWITWFKNNNAYHDVKDYTPKLGDMIFFDYDKNGVSDHNGIVKGVEGTKVKTIEGNVDAQTKECEYELTDANIKGYGTPLFDKVPTENNSNANNNTNNTENHTEVQQGAGGTIGGLTKASAPITGIDVSFYNGSINWSQVKNSEAKFAYIRVGGRESKKGSLYTDSKFYENIKGATQAGVDVGVYFYTQAVTTQEAVAEAKFVLEKVKGYNLKYPIAIDSEKSPSGKRTDSLSKAKRTDIMKAFCDTISAAGYKSQIYTSKSWFVEKLNITDLNSYDKWVAHYTSASQTNFAYPYSVWQYTDKGSISGIRGSVDMNKCYVNY